MPGAIVTYSYPIKGNEAVIGKNFLKITERKKDVLLAIDTKKHRAVRTISSTTGRFGTGGEKPDILEGFHRKRIFLGLFGNRIKSSGCA